MEKFSEKKKEGFSGQRAIMIPRDVLAGQCQKNPIISSLYTTYIGYYPKAEFHYRERPHGADQHILIYCIDGYGTARIKKEEYKISPGEFIVIPAKIAHYYFADKENPWTIYWLHFKGDGADGIVNFFLNQNSGHKGFIQYGEKIIGTFNDIYAQLERGYSNDNLLYSNMSLWHFFSCFMFDGKYVSPGITRNKDEIDDAIDYLSKNLDQTLTIENIASSVNLSVSHFSHLFKKKTGFTAIEYFNHLKIQKACQFLLFTNMRINEVALEVGFTDPFYFSRLFSRVMNISPTEYRDKKVH